MKKVKVKICGINTKETLIAAKKADFIGFVFYPKSPRFINAQEALELCKYCRLGQHKVGLFVNSDINLISFITEKLSLDYVQLHGNESIDEIKLIKKKIGSTKIIKSIGIKEKKDLKQFYDYEKFVDIILLDTKYEKNIMPGGHGKKFNWKFLENIQFNKEWMLAGGINYDNLQYSLSITNAPIVDVSSGVEIKKGIKTKQKIIDFLDLAESLQ